MNTRFYTTDAVQRGALPMGSPLTRQHMESLRQSERIEASLSQRRPTRDSGGDGYMKITTTPDINAINQAAHARRNGQTASAQTRIAKPLGQVSAADLNARNEAFWDAQKSRT